MSLEKMEIVILKGGSASFANASGVGTNQDNVDRTMGFHIELKESGLATATAQVASGSVVEGRQYCIDRGIDYEQKTFAELARRGTASQMQRWTSAADKHDREVTQILATNHELDDEKEKILIRRALMDEFWREAVPIINENQASGQDELGEFLAAYIDLEEYGKKDLEPDNDWLAAHVAIVVSAKYLVLQSQSTDGFTNREGEVIEEIKAEEVDSLLEEHAYMKSVTGTGGIESKMKAMVKAVESGKVEHVIYGNADISPVDMILGKSVCTRVVQ